MRYGLGVILLLIAGACAAAPVEPPRGSETRRDMLDALRPFAEYDLGPPVEFVVDTLLFEGDRGFARVRAQRPGGRAIAMQRTPLVLRDNEPFSLIDGTEMVAFLYRQGGIWRPEIYEIGATDAWWAGGTYCDNYAAFLPREVCP